MTSLETNRVEGQRLSGPPKLRRNLNEVLWVSFGYGLAALGQIAGVRMLTSRLAPSQYGEVALAVTIGLLVQQVVYSPVANGALRFFSPAMEGHWLGQYFSAVHVLARKTNLAFAGLSLLALGFLSVHLGGRLWPLGAAAFAYAGAFGYTTILNGIQNAGRNRAIVACHGGVAAWLRAGLALGFVLCLGATSANAVWGYAVASMLVLASQWFFFRKLEADLTHRYSTSQPDTKKKPITAMWKYGSPFVAWGVFSWLQSSSDRWVLEVFSSTAAVGRYQALYQVFVQPMIQLSGFAVQLGTPIIFAKAGEGLDKSRLAKVNALTARVVGATLGVTLVFAGLVISGGGGLLGTLVGPQYRSDLWVAPYLVMVGGIYAATQIASIAVMASNDTTKLVLPRVVTTVATIGASAFGAYHYGAPGVIIANVITGTVMLVWILLLSRRIHRSSAHDLAVGLQSAVEPR